MDRHSARKIADLLTWTRIVNVVPITLLPALIVWGDVPWFVHGVLIVAIASKLELTWAF